jgi:hypothetical protein
MGRFLDMWDKGFGFVKCRDEVVLVLPELSQPEVELRSILFGKFDVVRRIFGGHRSDRNVRGNVEHA